ncbi:MAG: hypothetical protein NDI69_00475 [Bacteriovoracaceae bacterium]|nr:hypothetical protein [Bacteriovoracaceae bacterium]
MGIAKLLYLLLLLFFVACNGVSEEDVVDNLNLADNSTLEINPSNKVLYINQTQQFLASGGEPPYLFTLFSGLGSVSTTGLYTAPNSPGLATVRVTDAKGTTKEALVLIQVQVALSPSSRKLNVNSSFQFATTGGTSPYTYSVISGSSTISSNGTFTAAGTPETSKVRVVDSDGHYAEATVEVGDGPIISPISSNITVNSTIQFTYTSGTAPFTWSVITGGGTVNSSGLFTAASTSGVSTVRVMDANGFYSDAQLTVFKRKKVSASNAHTCVMDEDTNDVKCFGIRFYGNIGDGKYQVGDEVSDMGDNLATVKFPTTLTAEPLQMSSSRYNSCAIFSDGLTRCWGASGSGQNGNNTNQTGTIAGSMEAYLLPVPADLANPIVELAPKSNSDAHQCGIYQDGTLKCWGRNSEGQLGQNSTLAYGSNYGSANLYNALPVNLGQTVHKVELGTLHTCAILNDRNVKCWGYNDYGQLGRQDTNTIGNEAGEMEAIVALNFTKDITDIALGDRHTCVLDADGNVFCWGRNLEGQLGLGNTLTYSNEAGENPVALTAIPLGVGRTALKIDSGFYHTCALLDNSQVKCWGNNGNGQLGQEDVFNRGDNPSEMGDNLPSINLGTGLAALDIYVGGHSTCVLLNNGKIKCWGNNSFGQLGLGLDHRLQQGDALGEMGDNLPELNLGSGVTSILHMTPFTPVSCVLMVEGGKNVVKCFGANDSGNMGLDNGSWGDEVSELGSNLSGVDLGTSKTIADVIGGTHHTCTLFTDGSGKCWGNNSYNVLGANGAGGAWVGTGAYHMGSLLSYIIPGSGVTISKLAFSREHYSGCAILSGNVLKCWGYNGYGQLGQNNYTNYSYIPTIPPIDLGGLAPVDVSVGYVHSCAILSNGTVKCWGRNNFGQLGVGDTTDRGGVAGNMAALSAINLGTGVTSSQICSGVYSNCVKTSSGQVKCWGLNTSGQLGLGHTNNMGDGATEMGDNLPFLDLGTSRTVTKLACGSYHVCAILDNKKVKCWGANGSGQLGYGSTNNVGPSASQMGDNLAYVNLGTGRTAIDLVSGANHTCAVLDNNDIKCWGSNSFGQLGQGSILNLGDQLGEMGNNLQAIDLD